MAIVMKMSKCKKKKKKNGKKCSQNRLYFIHAKCDLKCFSNGFRVKCDFDQMFCEIRPLTEDCSYKWMS